MRSFDSSNLTNPILIYILAADLRRVGMHRATEVNRKEIN